MAACGIEVRAGGEAEAAGDGGRDLGADVAEEVRGHDHVEAPGPAMSGAEPCTGSNIDGWRRVGSRFALGARPRPPVTVAVISEQMSPKRFEATITSKLQGRRISSMAAASTRLDPAPIFRNSAA